MLDEQKVREEGVFGQELSMDDLDAAAGGDFSYATKSEYNRDNCSSVHYRLLYGGGGFPNCAATVGRDSCCIDNDACYGNAVAYVDMKTDCGRSWE